MRAPVDAIDDGIGFTAQLVMQPAIDQTTDDRSFDCVAVDHEIGKAAILVAPGEGAVHGLDDVAADSEIAQRAFGSKSDRPLAGLTLEREVHLLEMLEAADHEAAQFGI